MRLNIKKIENHLFLKLFKRKQKIPWKDKTSSKRIQGFESSILHAFKRHSNPPSSRTFKSKTHCL